MDSHTVYILIVLLVVTAPYTQGLVIETNGIAVDGKLLCTKTGNPTPGIASRGIPGANVTISCNEPPLSNTTHAVTNGTGVFNTTILGRLSFGIRLFGRPRPIQFQVSCYAHVHLPIRHCTLLPSNGVLQANLSFIDFTTNPDDKLFAKFEARNWTLLSTIQHPSSVPPPLCN